MQVQGAPLLVITSAKEHNLCLCNKFAINGRYVSCDWPLSVLPVSVLLTKSVGIISNLKSLVSPIPNFCLSRTRNTDESSP